jgi:hypothetical protein
VLRPRVDPVFEACVRLCLGVREQPRIVDCPRVIATARLRQDIRRLAVAPQPPVHRRATDAEHLGGRLVRFCEPFAIGVHHATPHLYREVCHRKV